MIDSISSVGSRKKYLRGVGTWPLIIWKATTAKRNYYIEPEKIGGRVWARFGVCAPWPQPITATVDFIVIVLLKIWQHF